MSIGLGPKAVTTGLIYSLDAGNQKSYNYNLASYTNNFSGGWGWNATAATGQNDPFNGTNAIKITATNNDPYGQTNSALPYVYAGRTYNYSMWMKGEGTAIGKNFTLALYDGTTWVSGSWGTNYVITAGWQRISQTFTPANSGSAQLRLDCPESGTPAVGDVCYLYGLQFTEGSSLLPYVSNSSTATPTTMFNQANTSQTATMTNGVAWSNGIMTFDGSDDYVNLGINAYNLGINQNGTFSGWMMSTSGAAYLVSDWNSVGMTIRMNDLTSADFYVYPNNHRITASYSFTVNTWYHFAGVMSGANMYLYINGVQVGTTTLGEPIGSSASTLKIGGRGDGSPVSSAQKIGLLQIYNRALSSAEVLQNFKATRGRFGV